MIHKPTLVLAAALLANAAGATTLINTGTPDGSQLAYALDSSNFLAVAFDAPQAWRIDSVAAFLAGGVPGDHFTVALYQDAPGKPGDLLAAATVSFDADGWNAASGLAWTLPGAGHYWLALEGADGAFTASAGGLAMPGVTAFADGGFLGYQAYPGIQFGLQVAGAVPEPTTGLLLLAGLGLLAGGLGRRQHPPV
jgi:hypothetical protein